MQSLALFSFSSCRCKKQQQYLWEEKIDKVLNMRYIAVVSWEPFRYQGLNYNCHYLFCIDQTLLWIDDIYRNIMNNNNSNTILLKLVKNFIWFTFIVLSKLKNIQTWYKIYFLQWYAIYTHCYSRCNHCNVF